MRIWTLVAVAAGMLLAVPAQAGAMKFKVIEVNCPKNCTKVLLGEGEIQRNTDRAFRAALRRVGPGTPVVLHSGGGDLVGGVMLGYAFRETGSTVGVAPNGACFSACAYAMLGGKNRLVLPGGQFGVHRFEVVGRKTSKKLAEQHRKEDEEVYAALRRYAREMGVSPEVVGLASNTDNRLMKVLSSGQLRRMRVVTGG